MNFYAVHLWPLWLLLLLAFFGLLSWKSLAGGTTGRRAVAFALRAGVLALLALALMDIHWTRVAERLAVVFVMDRSQSVPPSLREEALSRVRAATATLEEETLAGMVVFGEAASIESTPDPRPDFSRIASVVGADRTDVGAALRLAGSSFPHGVQKRIVLLSDGRPNLGEALREAAAVRGQGAVVDVVPLLYGHVNDVRVEKVVAPARVAEGEPIPLRIVLQAGAPARVRLDLRLDGKTVAQEEVVLDAGKTVLPIERPVEGPGFHTFEVQVDAPDDSQPQNNRGFAFTIVSGKPRVLVIEDVPGEARFLLEALRLHGVEAQGIPPSAGPVTPSEFQAWDAVFLCNVPADAFSSDQLKALEAGVRDLGLGLVMIGGEHSFGAGDWNGTPVENALPVFAEVRQEKILPNGAMVLIMHTCEFSNGNRWAKRICRDAIDKLTPEDYAGLLYFSNDGGVKWLFELQRIEDKQRLFKLIGNLTPEDMPDFDDALTKAYKALKDSPSAMRHVVIVSDGDPHPPGALLKRAMVQARITVSTVCIHPHEGDLNALQVMQDLATVTGGRAYFPKQPEELPGILIREAAIVKRNFIKEELFRPVHAEHSEILKGLPAGALPPLRGRVVCTEKPTAAVPLRSPEGDPVLAHWRFGLGRSVAFTSDAKNRWASEWVAWPDFPKFWGQAASWCLRTLSKNNFRVAASVEGGKGKVAVDALDAQGAFVDGLAVEARTVTPSSKTLSVPLKQTGPGRYEGEFDAVEVGTYPVAVSFSDPQGNAGALAAGMALSYSPEFRTEGPDLAFLAALAEAGGGKVRAGLEGVFDRDLPSARSPVPQWHVFLIAAAFLFLLDVFHRRVAVPYERAFAAAARVPALAFRLVAGRLAAPPAGRDATLETLLRKKADVAREREAEAAVFEPSPGTPGVAPGPARAAPAAGSGAPGSGGARAEKPPPPAEDPPFTKRLLDAKKRAWKKEDEAK